MIVEFVCLLLFTLFTICRKIKTTYASYATIQMFTWRHDEVFKIVHDFYHLKAAVKLDFNTFSITRGNKYKLQKFSCHYNRRKFSFSSTICGTVFNITWLRLILLILWRIVLLNIGLIKMFCNLYVKVTLRCRRPSEHIGLDFNLKLWF